ncbi:unnamed protein product [Sphacelaria rigidula]
MLCVDDYSRFKIVHFLKHKDQAAGALMDIIASHISPAGLKIGIIRTDGGGEFEGEFQNLLNSLSIKPEKTPPHTPQYNGVAERALGILRDKTVVLLRELEEGKNLPPLGRSHAICLRHVQHVRHIIPRRRSHAVRTPVRQQAIAFRDSSLWHRGIHAAPQPAQQTRAART